MAILDIRRRISLSLRSFLALLCLMSFGWVVAIFLLGRFDLPALGTVGTAFLYEISKAVFLGTSVGLFVNYYLRRTIETGGDNVLETHGIQTIHASRLQASQEFLAQARDPRVKTIFIAGISLRDFLSGGGALQNVWTEIRHRLELEQQRKLPDLARLRVRVLLLDPHSGAGRFRHRVEKGAITAGLETDVPMAVTQVQNIIAGIYGSDQSNYLEVCLYEHSPFAFLFITDKAAYVEQYCYRDHTRRTTLPLIKYGNDAESYAQLLHSCEVVWNAARPARLSRYQIGTADGIMNARILNIFRHDFRDQLGRRQIECIRSAGPGDRIRIQAITGKFYMQAAVEAIRDVSSAVNGQTSAEVRFLIINPVSQQAILRAVADSCKQDQIGDGLQSWDWKRHINSKLYIDAKHVIYIYRQLLERGCSIKLRLTPAALTSALLLTPKHAFIEQYVYGRSRRFREGIVLGAEFPVMEFEMGDGVEQEILKSGFDVMWECFAIDVEKYEEVGEQDNFQRSLEMIRACRKEDHPHPLELPMIPDGNGRFSVQPPAPSAPL